MSSEKAKIPAIRIGRDFFVDRGIHLDLQSIFVKREGIAAPEHYISCALLHLFSAVSQWPAHVLRGDIDSRLPKEYC